MPSKVECEINSFFTPSKNNNISNKKWGSPSINKQYFNEFENKKENNIKDLKIISLETKITNMQKENSELREMLNNFMIMRIKE